MKMSARPLFVCWLGLVLLQGTATAQDSLPRFPRNPASWLNASPITEETLKGKAALLYFFEET